MVIPHQNNEEILSLSLSSSNAYRNFIDSIRSEFSKRLYTRILKAYMRHYNYTDVDSLIHDKDVKQIESEIISYLVKKRQPPYSLVYSSLNSIKGCLVTFYAMNDILLNSKKIGRYLGEQQRAHMDRAYTVERNVPNIYEPT